MQEVNKSKRISFNIHENCVQYSQVFLFIFTKSPRNIHWKSALYLQELEQSPCTKQNSE